MTLEGPRTEEAGPNVDPTGAPVEDAGLDEETTESTRPNQGRVLDRGAVSAAFVGLGMAVTIAISFELIIAIQALVFVSAPFAGLVIGYYANNKSGRWRPRWRLFANAGFAGAITGLSLALMYVGLRLLFIYADSGYRPETMGGQLECSTGPECTYARFLDDGNRDELVADGITDAASFEIGRLALAGRERADAHADDHGWRAGRGRLARGTNTTGAGGHRGADRLVLGGPAADPTRGAGSVAWERPHGCPRLTHSASARVGSTNQQSSLPRLACAGHQKAADSIARAAASGC